LGLSVGGGKQIDRELQDLMDFENNKYMKELEGAYGDPEDDECSRLLGRAHVFRMPDRPPTGNDALDERREQMDYLMAVKKWMVGMQMHKQPHIRFPYATRRMCGRTWPGEERRLARKAGARK